MDLTTWIKLFSKAKVSVNAWMRNGVFLSLLCSSSLVLKFTHPLLFPPVCRAIRPIVA